MDMWRLLVLEPAAGRDKERSAPPKHPTVHLEFSELLGRAHSLPAEPVLLALLAQWQVPAQWSTPPRSVDSTRCGNSFFTSERHSHSRVDPTPRLGHWQK